MKLNRRDVFIIEASRFCLLGHDVLHGTRIMPQILYVTRLSCA